MVKRSGFILSRRSFHIFVIIIVVALAFLPGLAGDFLNWDDTTHVTDNIAVQSFDVAAMFRQTVQKIYVPLTTLSFAVEHKFFGFNPFVYHLDNLFLHVLNCLLVYFLAQRLGLSGFAALIAALVFGVHPMKVESVAWVTERKDLLYVFFYLLALQSYITFVVGKSWRSYAVFFVFGVLSLLAKPMALSLPLVVLLMDWFLRRRFTYASLIEKAPLILVFIPLTWITYSLHVRNPLKDLGEAVLMWAWSFSFYIWKFFWPDPLVPVYPIFKPVGLSNPVYVLSLAFLAVMVVGLFLWRRYRWWLFSVGFYFLSIFFLLRFDPTNDIHVVADRFMYLPCLGFCFLIGMGADRTFRYFETRGISGKVGLSVLAGAIVFMLAFKSMEQSKVWNNSIVLWTHVIRYNPTAFLAFNDRAVAYIDRGQNDLALEDYTSILKFDPQNADAYFNRGLLFKKIGRYRSATDDFSEVIARFPYYEKAYDHRGRAYEALGEIGRALQDYSSSVRVSPAFADGYMDRGNIYNKREQLGLALADYQKVIELEPSNARAINNIGTIHAKLLDNDRALADFNQVISIDPQNAEAYYNRSVVYGRKGLWEKALQDALKSRALGADVDGAYLDGLRKRAR